MRLALFFILIASAAFSTTETECKGPFIIVRTWRQDPVLPKITDAAFAATQAKMEEKRAALRGAGVLDEHLPNIHKPAVPNDRVVVLVHGIAESPKSLGPLVKEYNDKGFTVVTVALKGHGSSPYALQGVTREDWRADIDEAIATAKTLGGTLSIAGYSIGATLALDASYRHGDENLPVILQSPFFQATEGALSGLTPGSEWTKWDGILQDQFERKDYFDRNRYRTMPRSAWDEMIALSGEVRQKWAASRPPGRVHLLYVENDRMTDPAATQAFATAAGNNIVTEVLKGRSSHADGLSPARTPPEEWRTTISRFITKVLSP